MRLLRFLLIPLALLIGCSDEHSSPAAEAQGRPFEITQVGQFTEPWAIAFMPDGRALVTEKRGGLKIWRANGTIVDVAGAPQVAYGGQGGMLDVALAPDFASSRTIYMTYAEPGAGGSSLALARARLAEGDGPARLDGFAVIWRQLPRGEGGQYGGIIAFDGEGRHLFLSSGERQRFTPAQDPDQALGKILRLNLDGTTPPDNPMASQGGVRAQTFSTGHRNPYGLALDFSGLLWEHEMGPRGGDELNLIRPGRNYGWPNVSNGRHYDGRDIPDHRPGDGYAAPELFWNPSVSPSGMIIYRGAMFPEWQGSALIGALSGQALIRVRLNGNMARKEEQWDMQTRIRDVAEAPDGSVYLLEDGAGGRLFRLTPVRSRN